MSHRPSITIICVPDCGHARAVRELLRRRKLRFTERRLTAEDANQIIASYHRYGSPLLLINGEVINGQEPIMRRIESLAAGK